MEPFIDIYNWNEEGYCPLVFSHDWQVAILNWEPAIDRDTVSEIERHNHSDEVFVLIKGKAILFVHPEGEELSIIEMQPGLIYNVLKGTWHNLVASRDVELLIIENRDTHLHDVEIRPISPQEKTVLAQHLPDRL